MLIPSLTIAGFGVAASLSRGMNANSQPDDVIDKVLGKSIKRDEC